MNKEKVFFIVCSFVLVMAITIYSVSSDKPDVIPVISTYSGTDASELNIVITTIAEKFETTINYPIDINFATKEELCSLDGIGETLSDRIIKYRKNNYFYSIEDIKKVDGIGKKFLDENKDKIFVDLSRLPEITTTYHSETNRATNITSEIQETTVSETNIITTTIISIESSEKELTPVNLNTATYEELISLPISPEIAEQIIELRGKIGYFSSTKELYYIEGYSHELYIELLEYVYVE
ncbi:MAG: helix-hairpin-helix domain-containing protein [Oscillospiraceae bacterium]|nr:helix-hairpin-helix domain-containing protein [Oscillospiraceae bacterium]